MHRFVLVFCTCESVTIPATASSPSPLWQFTLIASVALANSASLAARYWQRVSEPCTWRQTWWPVWPPAFGSSSVSPQNGLNSGLYRPGGRLGRVTGARDVSPPSGIRILNWHRASGLSVHVKGAGALFSLSLPHFPLAIYLSGFASYLSHGVIVTLGRYSL